MAAVLSIRRVSSSSASPALLDEIHQLLLDVFVDDFTDDDWAHCCGGWHVLVMDGSFVVAHAAVGARSLEVDGRPWLTGYVEGVAVDAGRQGEGIGSLLMDDVGDRIRGGYEMGGRST